MTDQRGLGPGSSTDGPDPDDQFGIGHADVDDPYGTRSRRGRTTSSTARRWPPAPVKKKMNPLVEWVIVVAVAITSALLVRAYVVQQFAVEGESMLSTLQDGDRVLVNRMSYRLHDPRRGDVVVLKRFDSPTTPERDLIKRVVALEGERVRFTDCVVYINDQPLTEPYLDPAIQQQDGCGGNFSRDHGARQLGVRARRPPWQVERQPGVRPRAVRAAHRPSVRHHLADRRLGLALTARIRPARQGSPSSIR